MSTWLLLKFIRNGEFGASRPEGGEGDRVSEHEASVESLREMGSSVLRYQRRGERRSSE